MKLYELLREAGLPLPQGVADTEVTGISSDSRTVEAGEIFVAICGLHHDASRFVGQALARGAVLAVCERPLDGHVLVVDNAREALARLWDARYGHPARGMRLIGVTGTNGKTSTATMLAWILQRAGHRCGLIGTVECRLGELALSAPHEDRLANMTTPDPAQLYRLLAEMRDGGATHVVMEVTSHALAFSKTAPLRFWRGVFTNLSPDHLDLHGDMESYFAEKRKLFDRCDGAVISCFGDYGVRLADGLDLPLWRVDNVSVTDRTKNGCEGVGFTLHCPTLPPLAVSLPVAGDFSVENGALAVMTALSMGLPPSRVAKALSGFTGVRGRMERVAAPDFPAAVFLDYAHTPDALEKLLRTVREFAADGRITLVFGCGGDRDRSKRAQMGRIASQLADLVVLTSDNCRSERPEDIARDVLKGMDKEKPFRVILDRAQAIAYAVDSARAGDILLLTGKGHEEYEIRGRERLPFSERETVLACIARRREREGRAD